MFSFIYKERYRRPAAVFSAAVGTGGFGNSWERGIFFDKKNVSQIFYLAI